MSKHRTATSLQDSANKLLPKNQQAHQNAQTFGWVTEIYANAISYSAGPPGLRGLMFFVGVFTFSIFTPLGLWSAVNDFQVYGQGLFDYLMIILSLCFAMAGIGFLIFSIRFEFFRPKDEPTIFDRKHRKIYRASRKIEVGITGLFKPWPFHYKTYSWDLIDAQHHASIVTTGSTVTRYHSLLILVRKSATDPTCVEQFTIGSSLSLGEQMVAPLWEHIRRFMEEDGPPLPPQDQLADLRIPQGWWESIKATLPKSTGQGFGAWLKQELPLALLLLALFPLTLPMYLLWGTGNWLSHKTAITIQWPDEVLEAIGKSLHSS